MRHLRVVVTAALLLIAADVTAQTRRPAPSRPARRPAAAAPAAPAPFVTPLTAEQMRGKQAVIETSEGRLVVDLRPDLAPNHVGLFLKTAQEGGYDGTVFHRVIRRGLIQGGDPLSKDPGKTAQYGTGGLNLLAQEIHPSARHVRGTVSAVHVPGRSGSSGVQFFVCLTDQPALDGQYTVFGTLVEGLPPALRLSEAEADEKGAPTSRLVITTVTIRDAPAPVPDPFGPADVAALAASRAVLETDAGDITLGFLPEKAPEHVRQFLRLAAAGVFDGTLWHRVVRGFVIQTGHMPTRREPLDLPQLGLVHPLRGEFSDVAHDVGIVSMARIGDDPDSAQTSFFITTARAAVLDGKYSAFARVTDGLDVVRRIESLPVDGETPVSPVRLRRVRVERP